MKKNSTRNARFFGLATLISIFLLSACASEPSVETLKPVEVRELQTPRPAPIVPSVDQIQLRDVKWIIITPENVDSVFDSLNGELVLFAVTTSGYESLALNLSDVRAMIQQQQKIIAIYKNSYRN